MLHIWDILMANWRTIKIDDFGRVQVKTVIPTSIVPTGKQNRKDSIQLVLSNQEIIDRERSVYGTIHNSVFRQMTAGEKIALMDEDIKIFGLQKKEEELRLIQKKEIDQKIEEYWKEKEQPLAENVDRLKLNPVERIDLQQSANVNQSVTLNSVPEQDNAALLGRSESQNVVTQLQGGQPAHPRQNVMNGF
jgi:hypothetical protein